MCAATPADETELSVLITVFDEEENLGPVLEELFAALDGEVSFEVVVVDDGSTDGSWPLLEAWARRDPRLRPLAHGDNRGKSAALVTAALAARGRWVATMDGDGQNVPTDLLALYREGCRATRESGGRWVVAGCRRKRRDTWFKRLQSRTANRVRRALLHDVTPDTGCGLKAMPRELFLELPRFAHMHRFLPALVQRAGGRVLSVPVEDRPRLHGASKYGFLNRAWVGVVDLVGVYWLRKRRIAPVEVERVGEGEGKGASVGERKDPDPSLLGT